jgi:hypothetical protein
VADTLRNSPIWHALSTDQKLALMAQLEANHGKSRMDDASNTISANVNRAQAMKKDPDWVLNYKAPGKAYGWFQPLDEPAQLKRAEKLMASPEHQILRAEAAGQLARVQGGEGALPDRVGGGTAYLGKYSEMTRLRDKEPNKYKDWGVGGSNWSGEVPGQGYKSQTHEDGSHAFIRLKEHGPAQAGNAPKTMGEMVQRYAPSSGQSELDMFAKGASANSSVNPAPGTGNMFAGHSGAASTPEAQTALLQAPHASQTDPALLASAMRSSTPADSVSPAGVAASARYAPEQTTTPGSMFADPAYADSVAQASKDAAGSKSPENPFGTAGIFFGRALSQGGGTSSPPIPQSSSSPIQAAKVTPGQGGGYFWFGAKPKPAPAQGL